MVVNQILRWQRSAEEKPDQRLKKMERGELGKGVWSAGLGGGWEGGLECWLRGGWGRD